MALITKKIKGTEDVLPKESYKWQFVEKIMREEARSYGFREIRTPVFEHTELFARGVGQTTDVVQKEMYTFDTKGGESVTLRPEVHPVRQEPFLNTLLKTKDFRLRQATLFRVIVMKSRRQADFVSSTSSVLRSMAHRILLPMQSLSALQAL